MNYEIFVVFSTMLFVYIFSMQLNLAIKMTIISSNVFMFLLKIVSSVKVY